MDKSQNKLNRGGSRWRRSSLKQNNPEPTANNAVPRTETRADNSSEKGKGRASEDGDNSSMHWSSSAMQNLIPERLKELPPWYNHEVERSAMAAMQFRKRYQIHNPVGPRWYKNHHLIPPQRRQGGRPSSIFSPSFPPISASTGDHPLHTVSMPAVPMRRTPSASPIPTPSSSAVVVNEVGFGPKLRSRRPSNGSPHDNVDMMDVSDPWGTNWHHQSPYDVGIRNEGDRSPGTVDSPDSQASGRQPNRHKTVTPSPLSQSTSAIHLQPIETEGLVVSKKLSKRRKTNPFGSSSSAPDTLSAPVTPVITETPAATPPISGPRRRISLRPSASTTDVPLTSSLNSLAPPSSKKEKRGSLLVRIARRFSILKKPAPHPPSPAKMAERAAVAAENRASAVEPPAFEPIRRSMATDPRPSTESQEPPPPPATERNSSSDASDDDDEALTINGKPKSRENGNPDRSSMSILEAPFAMGKLTIANPDDSRDSAVLTPQQPAQLPLASPPPVRRASVAYVPPQPVALSDPAPSPPSVKELPPRPPPTEAPMSDYGDEESELQPPRAPALRSSYFGSPALSAQTAPTIPSPSEIAYLSSPALPPQDEIPSIPSPATTAAAMTSVPTSDTLVLDPPAPRFTPKTAPWAEEARISVMANPPTPYTGAVQIPPPSPSPQPRPSMDEVRAPRGPRNPSPTKSRHNGERVQSPLEVPVAPASPTGNGASHPGTPSREPSPTKISRDRSGTIDHTRSPSVQTREREVVSPTRSNREGEREKEHSRRESSRRESRQDSEHTRRDSSRRDSDHVKSSSTPTSMRRTETFRLVRSTSGNVVTSPSETIMANGQHWEVVEQPVLTTKRSSRRDRAGSQSLENQEPDASGMSVGRKEGRRKEREKEEAETNGRKESRREKDRKSQDGEDAAAAARRESRRKERRRSEAAERATVTPVSSSRHSEDKQRQANPEPPRQSADTSRSHHERRASQSTRPTSEIPSAADISSLKARDAYELERMWKGRSATLDSGSLLTPPGPHTVLPVASATTTHAIGPSIGSSHTSYSQPTPFSAPVMVYPASYGAQPASAHTRSAPTSRRLSTESRPLSNPLPEPPRQSVYKAPGPLAPAIGESTPGSREYWSKYAGLTASH